MHQKTKGAILRSKARWHKHGEHNTDQLAILEEEKRFYKAFYKSQSIDNDTFLTSSFFKTQNITPLTQEEMESCEGLLSEDECLNAIKEFKNNKSHRTDGFTSEFYKFFWPELRSDITSSFNYAFQKGTLSISQRHGIISLIPKKDKDKTIKTLGKP